MSSLKPPVACPESNCELYEAGNNVKEALTKVLMGKHQTGL